MSDYKDWEVWQDLNNPHSDLNYYLDAVMRQEERNQIMNPGNRYLVRFRAGGQRVDRDMVAVYLGWSRTNEQHQFSLRPHGGTTALSSDELIAYEPTTEAVRLPRKAPNDTPAAA